MLLLLLKLIQLKVLKIGNDLRRLLLLLTKKCYYFVTLLGCNENLNNVINIVVST